MKAKQTKNVLLLLLLFFLVGCTQELDRDLKSQLTTDVQCNQEEKEDSDSEDNQLRSDESYQSEELYKLTQEDRNIIKRSYDDFKTLAFETQAIQAQPLSYSSYAEVPVSEIAKNPMIPHLQFLDIEDADTHEKLHFYDLPLEEREVFLNCYLQEEQKMLEEKIEIFPEMLEGIEHLNTARNVVFEREGISRLDTERKYLLGSTPLLQSHVALTPVAPRKDLFELVEEELMKQGEEQGSMQGGLSPEMQPMLCSSSAGKGGKTISPPERIIKQYLEIGASRGDILMYKPHHWFGKEFSWGGHVGFLNRLVYPKMSVGESFSIDSTPRDEDEGTSDGVQEVKFKSWCRPHYVLGLHRVIFVWKRAKWPELFQIRIIIRPFRQVHRLVRQARKYIGVPYGGLGNSMEIAPEKFICSSLVWYCVKQLYGVDISNGSTRTVWPMDIYNSSYTYVKGGKKLK